MDISRFYGLHHYLVEKKCNGIIRIVRIHKREREIMEIGRYAAYYYVGLEILLNIVIQNLSKTFFCSCSLNYL